MESIAAIEDGDWSSFGALYSTEEADFMAQLLGNFSLPNELPNRCNLECSSTYWPGSESDVNMAGIEGCSLYFSDDTCANINSFSQGSSYSGGSSILFPISAHHHSYYPSHSGPILMRNDSPFSTNYCVMESKNMITNLTDQMDTDNLMEGEDFLNQDVSNDSMEFGGKLSESVLEGKSLQLGRENEIILAPETSEEDNLSEISKKRSRIPQDVQKNKRMVKAKKNDHQKLNTTEKVSEGSNSTVLHRQSSSSCISDDDSNASPELNGGVLLPSCYNSKVADRTELNLNSKTRASRGSATDPQSLYARKRREKINERLRILQNLVPNGTKVDISTMLEEAVQYVKFLQLQIKLLSSDDLWMYAPIAYNGMDIGLDLNLGR